MKSAKNAFFRSTLALSAALLMPVSGAAQTNLSGPSGGYTNFITDRASGVWDLSWLLKSIAFEITDNQTNPVLTLSYSITAEQLGTGKLRGSGSTTVHLSLAQTNNEYTNLPPFEGSYKVKGSMSSYGLLGRSLFSCTVTGYTSVGGILQKLRSTHTVSFLMLDKLSTGMRTESVTLRTLGKRVAHQPFGPLPLSSLLRAYGYWTLSMTLSTADNHVSGPALVKLESGKEFLFNVKGLFRPRDQSSNLVLTARDEATKGSTLRVTMLTNTVTRIRGHISGQAVNARF